MTEVREIKIKKLEADRKNYPQWRAAAIDLLCARDVDWVHWMGPMKKIPRHQPV